MKGHPIYSDTFPPQLNPYLLQKAFHDYSHPH